MTVDELSAQVLAALQGRGARQGGGRREWQFACPLPGRHGSSPQRRLTARYNEEKKAWQCWSCGADGGLLVGDHPLVDVLGLSHLRQSYTLDKSLALSTRDLDFKPQKWGNREAKVDLEALLAPEGIHPLAIEEFRLRADKWKGQPAIAIPWTIQDRVSAVQFRLIGDDLAGGRYRWAAGGQPTLFNINAALEPREDEIYVVEGAKKAMVLWSHGITSVCAVSAKKAWKTLHELYGERLLKVFAPFSRVVFVPDPDSYTEFAQAAASLKTGRVVRMPLKPDDLLVSTGGDVDCLMQWLRYAEQPRPPRKTR